MAEKGPGRRGEQEAASTGSSWTTTPSKPASTGEVVQPSMGRTTVAALVVQKIAAIATLEVTGVAALGAGIARAFGALRERIPGASASQTTGVAVEVGERQAAIDLAITAEYGVAQVEVARMVRRNVIKAVQRMTGLEVVAVNITVEDVRLPEDGEQTQVTRVE
ncbi:Asp23/Gls24 family envelope stress response protein [Saccharopolyspora hattusasensis]|uniref:Asp23/Gls24 family envelope stress response protein n=1 Tax=Saccharopolyspora hattusasensis TaxID=1128679 RepID=UPI003D97A948